MRGIDKKTMFDVIVVGAGIAGLYAVYLLRQRGFNVHAFEKGGDVGGVWYWNRYPGARCDVESLQYSYGFSDPLQQEWRWSERYATQPEILAYIRHVADRFDLRRHFSFLTQVDASTFDQDTGLWSVRTNSGEQYLCRWLVMASGPLSVPRSPTIPGIERYAGETYHTGAWPEGVSHFGGKSVGVIGTGSSGVQAIPVLAADAKHVTVFQRTPNFVIPSRTNILEDAEQTEWKAAYNEHRARAKEVGTLRDYSQTAAMSLSATERHDEYTRRWQAGGTDFIFAFSDILTNEDANKTAAEFVHQKIREIVKDPKTADMLLPTDHPIGAKRICVGSGYYETYNRDNVTLVDLRKNPIVQVEPNGIRTRETLHELDALVFATGYDALTGALTEIDIRGRTGISLKEKWKDGPETYLGLMTADFPNLFIVTGPGSPSVLINMFVALEHHVEWIADCVVYMRERGLTTIEAKRDAERAWVAHVNEEAEKTLFPRANSWYVGANIPGKPRVFLPYAGGIRRYREICSQSAIDGYTGFQFGPTLVGAKGSVEATI